MAIREFQGPHRFLSNFYPATVMYDGLVFRSVEHAYQAAKTDDWEVRKKIQALEKSGDAKKAGYRVPLREDWDRIKFGIMETLVRRKFEIPELRNKLLMTGDQDLIEGNWWGDTFWGVCRGKGENHLGKILMKIREEIRKEAP